MPTMRIKRTLRAALCVAFAVAGFPAWSQMDRGQPEVAALLGHWHVVLQGLPAHPMARLALDAFMEIAPGETRQARLNALALAFPNEPLGLYALETWQAEGAPEALLRELLEQKPRTRVAGRAFDLLLETTPEPLRLCEETIAQGSGAPARRARLYLAERKAEGGDSLAAFALALPVFQELLALDTQKAGALYARLKRYTAVAGTWPLKPEVDAVLQAPDVQAQQRAIERLLPLLTAPDDTRLRAAEEVWPAREFLAGAAAGLLQADVAAFDSMAQRCLAAAGLPGPVVLGEIALSLQQLAHQQRDTADTVLRARCEAVARDAAWTVLEIAGRPQEAHDAQRDLLARAAAAFRAQGRWEPERDALELLVPLLPTAAERVPRLMRMATTNYFYWRDFGRVIEAERQLVQDFPEAGQRESTRYGMAVAHYLREDYAAARAAIEEARPQATEKTRDKLITLGALAALREGNYEAAVRMLEERLADPAPSNDLRQAGLVLAYAQSLLHGDASAVPGYLRMIEAFPDHRSTRTLQHVLRQFQAAPLAREAALPPARPEAPNVLLISLDTVRADFLGCYGSTEAQTPNLDALARRGVTFEQAFSTSSWTKPSHASVFTGRFAQTHGAMRHDERVSEAWPVLPELLRAQGYDTLGVISAPPLQRLFGFGRGFRVYDDQTYLLDRQADLFLRRYGNPPVDIHAGYTGSLMTDRAIQLLQRRDDAARPFLLFVNYFDAHHSYLPPYRDGAPRYAGTQYGEIDRWNGAAAPLNEPEDVVDAPRLKSLYREEIRYVDEQVGRLVDHLKETGRFDNTVIVVFADHGDEFLEHGQLAHGRTLHNEVLHVPFLISGPGIGSALRSATPVSLADLLPTLLAQLGIEAPEGLDGVRLLAQGKPAVPEGRHLLAWLDLPPFRYHALVAGGQKLILDEESGNAQLFDLGKDWNEQHDRAADAPEAAAGMLGDLAADRARASEALSRLTGSAPLTIDAGPESVGELVEQLRALGYVR